MYNMIYWSFDNSEAPLPFKSQGINFTTTKESSKIVVEKQDIVTSKLISPSSRSNLSNSNLSNQAFPSEGGEGTLKSYQASFSSWWGCHPQIKPGHCSNHTRCGENGCQPKWSTINAKQSHQCVHSSKWLWIRAEESDFNDFQGFKDSEFQYIIKLFISTFLKMSS